MSPEKRVSAAFGQLQGKKGKEMGVGGGGGGEE